MESCPSQGKWEIGQWNTDELIGKNFLFFEAQESGKLTDNRVKWRGDSFMRDSYQGRDLSGGWFDAGGMTSCIGVVPFFMYLTKHAAVCKVVYLTSDVC
ncbi:MAG: hypothetical protein HC767_10745 [Akkermansiaceae bacterium]|nr:hypothetical protein [Akkermansiaceae bacterium]